MDIPALIVLSASAAIVVAVLGRLAGRLEAGGARLEHRLRAELAAAREEAARHAERQRGEVVALLAQLGAGSTAAMADLRMSLERQLVQLRRETGDRLTEMRHTVDEKLQGTLDRRLAESFRQVSERLEQVHRGLGEMQSLASGVGDLKRVLGNVKTRGTWGEVQLGALLEQVLAPEQYARNVAVTGTRERVEFAIRLPGRGDGQPVWLPIDAKFPVEDYHVLVDAAERGDTAAVEAAGKALEQRLRGSARDIGTKYLSPPRTTDFALMFLPTEGLYAEALRRPGLADELQRVHRVVVAGPTTLAALLSSLRLGFQSLAVQQRTTEVWEVLGQVKTEFGKYAEVLRAIKEKLDAASSTVDRAALRTRAIERKLRDVQALPAPELELHAAGDEEVA